MTFHLAAGIVTVALNWTICVQRASATRHTLVLTNILFIAGACSDGDNGPQPISFDAPAVEAAFLAVDGVFTSRDWINFAALGQQFVLSATPNASVHTEDQVQASRVSIIPPELYGVTLTFDETEQRYLGDQSRNGAPDDGVRFVLYDVDPTNGQPIAAAETGHADIRDIGVTLPEGFAIEIQAVAGQAIFAEYTASFGLPETPALGRSAQAASLDHAGLELEGTFANGSSEVDLVGISGTVNGIEISDVELDLRDGTLSLAADILQDDATAMLDITMGVQLGPDQFLLTRAGTPDTYMAQLSVN